jgi:hypothetical protein
MLTPTETTAAFATVTKLINVVIKAYPRANHAEIAKATLEAWGEKRDTLEDQLSKLQARKKKSTTTLASINTKQDAIDGLEAVEPILEAMLDILKAQAKPVLAEVKQAA